MQALQGSQKRWRVSNYRAKFVCGTSKIAALHFQVAIPTTAKDD
jgi:hypothetical protein